MYLNLDGVDGENEIFERVATFLEAYDAGYAAGYGARHGNGVGLFLTSFLFTKDFYEYLSDGADKPWHTWKSVIKTKAQAQGVIPRELLRLSIEKYLAMSPLERLASAAE